MAWLASQAVWDHFLGRLGLFSEPPIGNGQERGHSSLCQKRDYSFIFIVYDRREVPKRKARQPLPALLDGAKQGCLVQIADGHP